MDVDVNHNYNRNVNSDRNVNRDSNVNRDRTSNANRTGNGNGGNGKSWQPDQNRLKNSGSSLSSGQSREARGYGNGQAANRAGTTQAGGQGANRAWNDTSRADGRTSPMPQIGVAREYSQPRLHCQCRHAAIHRHGHRHAQSFGGYTAFHRESKRQYVLHRQPIRFQFRGRSANPICSRPLKFIRQRLQRRQRFCRRSSSARGASSRGGEVVVAAVAPEEEGVVEHCGKLTFVTGDEKQMERYERTSIYSWRIPAQVVGIPFGYYFNDAD